MKKSIWWVACLGVLSSVLFAAGEPAQKKAAKPARAVKAAKPVKKAEPKRSAPFAVKREREGKPLQRFDWFYAQRAWPLGFIPAGMQAEGVFQMNRMERDRDSVLQALGFNRNDIPANQTTWTLVGSSPSETVGFNFPRTAGRVVAVAIEPGNSNVVYAGTSNGGVWKTSNGGVAWIPLSDTQPSLVIGSLIIDPRYPNTLYAGTGERTYGGGHASYDGAGILKTVNGGSSWTNIPGPWVGPLGSSVGGGRIASLALHPTNSQILLAGSGSTATTRGVFRSTDAAATWTRTLDTGSVNTVLFHPDDGSVAYAAVQQVGISKSTDGGVTWNSASAGLPSDGIGRIELAISRSSPNTLYAGLTEQSSSNLRGFYKSTDGAATWTQLANTPDYCGAQCFFDHMVTVHPTNADVVLVGGSDTNGEQQRKLFRTMDGGNSWVEISQGANRVGLHPDIHVAVFTADGSKLYVGHDGGVNSTTNTLEAGVNWTDLNAAFATTLYYPGLSIHPTNVDVSFAGTQDNGTQRYNGTLNWTEVACGDGGYTAIDPSNPSIVYAACQEIAILRSTNGGAPRSFNDAQTGLPDSKAERSQFIAPLVIDQTAPRNLYFGTFRVWQTTDGADNWRPISTDLSGNGESTVSALVVAPTDSNTVYAGYSNGKVFVRTNALAGGTDGWVERSTGIPGRHVTSLVVSPRSSTTVYATVSGYTFGNDRAGHVFRSADGGASWADISGNLPNVPANDVAIDPDVAGKLYAGTDVGVFVSTNEGGTWTPLGSGLPRVTVTSVRLHKPSRTLRAATFGRSAWDILVPLAGGGPLPTVASVGALDGASFKAPVAPGSIAAIFGTNLGTQNALAGGVPLPTQLAGASLTFNGNIAAPLFFAGSGQMNLQIPWELAGASSASLVATTANGASTAVSVSLAPAAPAMFSTNQQGTGQGVILIASTGEVAAPTGSIQGRAHRPVRKGEFLTIYCLGLGDVDNRPATGGPSPAAEPLARVRAVPSVTIGGADARVDFAGLAPGFVGLYQINVQVPEGAQAGDAVSVIIRGGGATSNTVTIAVE